ncbi:superoxide dismutase family protein [Streptomyces cinnamoneus]|uniref:superoxide dismutase family protein n=1 Tax=Streptomyces cinnamoneus TaxID=53446 RepID=UPI0033E26A5D
MSLLISVVAASMAIASPTGGMAAQALVVSGQFMAADGGTHQAVTFDGTAIPDGSRVTVTERTSVDGTRIELRVGGVQANRMFGAHVHTQPCGSTPGASGPHYQNVKDPKQPSTDPRYANAQNEVWLDFTTDGRGDGGAVSTVQWGFRAGEARSVVIHAHGTATGAGQAGTAGARLACVNVPFE